jgi:hypothetical protein
MRATPGKKQRASNQALLQIRPSTPGPSSFDPNSGGEAGYM